MRVIPNENVDFFDVDGTLVIHEDATKIPIEDRVQVQDPVSGGWVIVRINAPMVRLLKESSTRGSHVVVWSRGGYQWAVNVIDALGLADDVDTVMSKPLAYFDDTPVEQWLPYRVFIGPEVNYKSLKKEN